jgi:hypothetical protein
MLRKAFAAVSPGLNEAYPVTIFCDPQRGGCCLLTLVQISDPTGKHVFPYTCPNCEQSATITVHIQPLRVYAFGDESEFGDVIAHCLVAVEDHKLMQQTGCYRI